MIKRDGFRKHILKQKSNVSPHNISKCSKDVLRILEKHEIVSLSLCDWSRGYDCISHDLLVKKWRIDMG